MSPAQTREDGHRTRTAASLAVVALVLTLFSPTPTHAATDCVDYSQAMHWVSGTLLSHLGDAVYGNVVLAPHPFASGHTIAFVSNGVSGTGYVTAIDVTDPTTLDRPPGGKDELGELALDGAVRQIALDPAFPSRPYIYVTTTGSQDFYILELTDPDVGNPNNTDLTFIVAHSQRAGSAGVAARLFGSDTYLWLSVGSDPILHVYKINDPSNPVLMTSYTMGGDRYGGPLTLGASGARLYIPGQFGNIAVDISNPIAPVTVGLFGQSGVSRFTPSADGLWLYAVGMLDPGNGLAPLRVYSLSNPDQPSLVASLGSAQGFSESAGDMTLSGNTLFCAATGGVIAVDVTTPSSPAVVGSAGVVGSTSVYEYTSLGLAMEGNHVLALNPRNGLQVLDVSSPKFTGTIDTIQVSAPTVAVEGNLLVTADGGNMRVVDVSNSTSPVMRSTTPTSGTVPLVHGHYAYLMRRPYLDVWDLINPDAPALVASVSGGAAFGLGIGQPMAVYDAPDPQPDCIYSATGDHGLGAVVSLADPASPVYVGGIPADGYGIDGMAVSGDHLFVRAVSRGVQAYSLANPTAPIWVSEVPLPSSFSGGLAVQGNYAYAADESLYVVEVANPAAMTVVGTLPLLGFGSSISVVGRYAYITQGDGGIAIVDVSDPTHPKLKADPGPSIVRGADLAMVGDVLYVAAGGDGLVRIPSQCGDDPPVIVSSSPNSIGNLSSVRVTITGFGFYDGVTVSLSGPGTVVGRVVSTSASELIVDFDVTNAAPGAWAISATNADGSTATLAEALTIVPGGAVDVWASLSGPQAFRAGTYGVVDVVVHNDGNVDALGVLVVVSGIPPDWAPAVLNPGHAFYPTLPNNVVHDVAGLQEITLILSRVPAGGQAVVRVFLDLRGATTLTANLSAAAGANVVPSGGATTTAARPANVASTSGSVCGLEVSEETACLIAALDVAQSCGILVLPPQVAALASCMVDVIVKEPCYVLGALQTLTDQPATQELEPWAGVPQYYAKLLLSTVGIVTSCGAVLQPEAEIASELVDAFDCKLAAIEALECMSVYAEMVANLFSSHDPNAKLGPMGFAGGLIRGDRAVPYTVRFENESSATLPARIVTITDALQTNRLDASTLTFQEIGFGSQSHTFGANAHSFTTDFDLRPAQNMIVRATGGVNAGTGAVSVTMQCLDPATGLPPADPLVGWLPPDVTPPEGQGWVSFSVEPLAGRAEGDQVCNQASIVFDANAPIVTNDWCNGFDVEPPTSTVGWLDPVQYSLSVPIHCSGSDVGSGVKRYVLYASDNGGAPALWGHTGTGDAVFKGMAGHTYGFYSSAEDSASNKEALASVPDVTTTIDASVAVAPPARPRVTALGQLSPNPVSRGTLTLRYVIGTDLATHGSIPVSLTVYDVAGRVMKRIESKPRAAGEWTVTWDVHDAKGGRLAPGLYFLRFCAESKTQVRSLVVIE